MPLKRCTNDGKPGWKWGDQGKCYTGKDARKKALRQGRAIEVNKYASALVRIRRRLRNGNKTDKQSGET